ncbi:MAG: hypothetical protein WBA61_10650 [Aequorivita sp.]
MIVQTGKFDTVVKIDYPMDNNKDYNSEFKGIWTPKEYLAYKISDAELWVLSVLRGLDNEKGCYAKNKTIGEMVNKSEGRISKIIKSLEDKKLIICEYDYKNNNPRTIYLNIPSYKRPRPLDENGNSPSHKRLRPLGVNDQSINSKENNKVNKKRERELSHFDFLKSKDPQQIEKVKNTFKFGNDEWDGLVDYFNNKLLNKNTITAITFKNVAKNWSNNLEKNPTKEQETEPVYRRKIS